MRTALVLVAVSACGGSREPPAALAPRPPDSAAVAPVAPPQADPVDLPRVYSAIPVAKGAVQLVSTGSGTKERLALAPRPDSKQHLLWSMTIGASEGTSPPSELSTMSLTLDAEVVSVDATGAATYQMKVASLDASEASLRDRLSTMTGSTMRGIVAANGAASDISMQVDNPGPALREAIQNVLVVAQATPPWPTLPTEAIGRGAVWKVTSQEQFGGRVELTKVVTYEVIEHVGATWKLEGTTTLTGSDQTFTGGGVPAGTTISRIGGSGTQEWTLQAEALVPTSAQQSDVTFTLTAPPSTTLTTSLRLSARLGPQ